MRWALTANGDPHAVILADRHYSPRVIGSPRVAPPGRCVILRLLDGRALWVTSWPDFVLDGRDAWRCTRFRNESEHRASDLILEALAATRHELGDPPPDGVVTYVDPAKVRPNRRPGRVFERAGFRLDGITRGAHKARPNLLRFVLGAADVPPAVAPLDLQTRLFGSEAAA